MISIFFVITRLVRVIQSHALQSVRPWIAGIPGTSPRTGKP